MRKSPLLAHVGVLCLFTASVSGCGRGAGTSSDAGPAYTVAHGLMIVPAASPLRQRMVVEPLSASVADADSSCPRPLRRTPREW